MAQRTVALCEGKYIGIETIYTVIDGQQINIPEKVEELRVKSRVNKLFCPCGCGSNLILVAGDKNLREQHFRVKDGTENKDCHMPVEGKISVFSKIVLKCWLDEQLQDNGIETRVPIHAVDDINRKYEFTFLSQARAFALSYWRERANITNDKIEILESNAKGIRILYVVDASNGGCEGQYPEALMKLQNQQGYCLLLEIGGFDYCKADMKAVFYEKDNDGFWKEIAFAEGPLRDYSLDISNNVIFRGIPLNQTLNEAKENYNNRLQEDRNKRLEAQKKREEDNRRAREEEERKRQEQEKRRTEAEKQRLELENKHQEEKRQEQENFKRKMEPRFTRQETQIRDADGNRWIKCEYCGKIAKEEEFSSFGGNNRVNLGICKECSRNNELVKRQGEDNVSYIMEKLNSNKCPKCGGELKERNGKFGRFLGCSRYPECKYTRKIR